MRLRIDDCTLCGRCKMVCPVFRILKSEHNSARGWAYLKRKNILNDIFYRCALCGACKEACPGKIDLDFLSVRSELEEAGITTERFKKMAQDMVEHKTPYGRLKTGQEPDVFFSF
jgi:Fe-S oxidoreductase